LILDGNVACSRIAVCQYPLPPNAELDGDTGAAFAVCVSGATAISEVNARAAINILMTHLHVAEHCPFRRIKMTIALPLPVMVG
jgi:hypothetical protein